MTKNSNANDVSEVKTAVRRHWGGRAAAFDERPNHGLHSDEQRTAWLAVLERLAGTAPLCVLDIGCGTGFLSLLLAELGHDVTGIDIAPEMLEIASGKASAAGLAIAFRLGDAESLADPDDSYDLIVGRHVIWTLPDPSRAAQEWSRVLKVDGRVALIEGHWGAESIQPDYQPIAQNLPFYGGIESERLIDYFAAEGYRDTTVEPLMDAVLWGKQPDKPRYLIEATNGKAG